MLRVLFVRRQPPCPSFVEQQAAALREHGLHVDLFYIRGAGLRGYIRQYRPLVRKLQQGEYDLVHAHYGLSGLLCALQRRCPTVITFLGSDVNLLFVRPFSYVAYRLSNHGVFVEESMRLRLRAHEDASVIPYGIDTDEVQVLDKAWCRKQLGLDPDAKLVAFASSFDRAVKNYPLAKAAVDLLGDVSLLQLGDHSRTEYIQLLNAVDALLMTSFTEGSPVTVKEAMACNCPIVSTDVGDVRRLIEGTSGCFLTSDVPAEVAAKLQLALAHGSRTDGRARALNLDNKAIAARIANVYERVLEPAAQAR